MCVINISKLSSTNALGGPSGAAFITINALVPKQDMLPDDYPFLRLIMSPTLWGRHIVFALSICPSIRLFVCPSVRLSHFVSAQ